MSTVYLRLPYLMDGSKRERLQSEALDSDPIFDRRPGRELYYDESDLRSKLPGGRPGQGHSAAFTTFTTLPRFCFSGQKRNHISAQDVRLI